MSDKRIWLSSPHMGADERELLLDAFDSNWVAPLGPHVDAFEKEMAEYIGKAHAAALSAGTGALHLGLELLGVGPGDTVLTSTLTFAATANAISYTGATPVFIDSERESWNIDPALLGEELDTMARRGQRAAAVVPVDLYGQCADYDAILPLCAEAEVPVIEDAAEALGATHGVGDGAQRAGALGDLSILSFNGNKIITTSGGGMLLSDDAAQIERARFLATQARDPAPHYQHSTIGYNYRMSNLLAAVGRGQLRHLESRVDARRANNAFYRQALAHLPGLSFMPEASWGRSTCWLTCVLIDPNALGVNREAIRTHLMEKQIEARPVWKPMHLQPIFNGCRIVGGGVAKDLFERGLCLPSGSNLEPEDRQRVVDAILEVVG
ncbi:MAG: aminotransferase class I/II-fold pyridoxal phosphate-dependent enzyme [Deltaproteobacteria bacterium]|nr:aminotransferase class I/II-fold pyridoxal phosphate-dependent enzyme [Deltaproteobacteria bacterium]